MSTYVDIAHMRTRDYWLFVEGLHILRYLGDSRVLETSKKKKTNLKSYSAAEIATKLLS